MRDPHSEAIEEQIIAQSMTNFERLPMLDVIFERFGLAFAAALKSFTSTVADVELSKLISTTYAGALRELPENCLLAIAREQGWDASFAVGMDGDFLYAALDLMLGGRGGPTAPKTTRGFTAIERRIGQTLAELMLRELASSFRQVAEVQFEVERMEGSVQLASISKPISPCVLANFRVKLGDTQGRISILLPHLAVEPIRPLLAKVFFGDRLGADQGWRDHLQERITQSNVKLTAVLHEVEVPLADVLGWTIGSTLDLHVGLDHEATVFCSGEPVFRGATGRRQNGAVALRITKDLTPSKEALHDLARD
ncbi:FliM/FliN family flagellar motor switch protein [Frigidibacter sp. MR17.14]|uniref:flagellar motor switch protein FliM n=1 Tax=Frigidibacter sp. MR17.14 TaxID=3126509 RepID=UPI00301313F1